MPRSKSKTKNPSIEVRESGIHGMGVYAVKPIKKGDHILEYTGQRISARTADRRYQDNPSTYLFMIDENTYIDGLVRGNEARFINHSCQPNCVAYLEDEDRVMIYALKNIKPGTELCYDYQLTKETEDPEMTSTDYTCYCGTRKCRGTMMGQDA